MAVTKPKLAILFFMTGLLGGCSALSPGLYLDDSFKDSPDQPKIWSAKMLFGDKNAETGSGPAGDNFKQPKLYPITSELIAEQIKAQSSTTLTLAGLKEWYENSVNYQYHVGPGDVLTITVWDHPELTIPAGPNRTAEEAGTLIKIDGTIFYPYVGVVSVDGMTTEQIRTMLTKKIATYITNPQLDVRVAAFRNKKVLVTGETKNPGILPITDRPLSITEAINKSGGITPAADLSRVVLTRNGKTSEVNVLALYRGDSLINPLLQDGDQVNVPDNFNNLVYVLGEVPKPQVQPMDKGRLTLAQALAAAGGPEPLTSDARQVYVIRGDLKEPKVYQLDATSANALLLSTQFQLQPQDVVYVGVKGIARWNRIMSNIVPTIQALWQTRNLTK